MDANFLNHTRFDLLFHVLRDNLGLLLWLVLGEQTQIGDLIWLGCSPSIDAIHVGWKLSLCSFHITNSYVIKRSFLIWAFGINVEYLL